MQPGCPRNASCEFQAGNLEINDCSASPALACQGLGYLIFLGNQASIYFSHATAFTEFLCISLNILAHTPGVMYNPGWKPVT